MKNESLNERIYCIITLCIKQITIPKRTRTEFAQSPISINHCAIMHLSGVTPKFPSRAQNIPSQAGSSRVYPDRPPFASRRCSPTR